MSSLVLEDIDGHIFVHVEGFRERFFDLSNSTPALQKMLQSFDESRLPIKHDDLQDIENGRLVAWLDITVTENGLQWQGLQVDEPSRPQIYAIGSRHDLVRGQFVHAIVLIVQSGYDNYKQGFIDLCRTAGATFANDPLRLFVHAFIIYDTTVELWLIDRSGLYSDRPFNLLKEPDRFVQVIHLYVSQDQTKLGANAYLQFDVNNNHVLRSNSGNIATLFLSKEPIALSDEAEIISNAPTVYFASSSLDAEPDMVVKFKWRKEFETSEGELFETITAISPGGVVQLYHAEDVASTSSLRKGLKFGNAVKFKPQSQDIASAGSLDGMDACFVQRQPDRMGDEAYMNRILSCTVIYPRGLELENYQSPPEAIEAFHDAFRGLRALYQECGLIHRDISIFNILLTDPSLRSTSQKSKGFLIDIEGALSLRVPPARNQVIGTTVFKAIGLLQNKLPHTYRYDLESFFYSLLWFLIVPRPTKIRPPEGSCLRRWYGSGLEDKELATRKLHDMSPKRFQELLKEIHPDFGQFRGLALGIHSLLFPTQANGSIWTGTDKSAAATNALYDGIDGEFTKNLACI